MGTREIQIPFLEQPRADQLPSYDRSLFNLGCLIVGSNPVMDFVSGQPTGQINASYLTSIAPGRAGISIAPVGANNNVAALGWFPADDAGATIGSSFLWHGVIKSASNSSTNDGLAGRYTTTSGGAGYAGQFFLRVTNTGFIKLDINTGSGPVSNTTTLAVTYGVPLTVLINFTSTGADIISSVGSQSVTVSGMTSTVGVYISAGKMTIGSDRWNYTGHPNQETALVAWSRNRLPLRVVSNPWLILSGSSTAVTSDAVQPTMEMLVPWTEQPTSNVQSNPNYGNFRYFPAAAFGVDVLSGGVVTKNASGGFGSTAFGPAFRGTADYSDGFIFPPAPSMVRCRAVLTRVTGSSAGGNIYNFSGNVLAGIPGGNPTITFASMNRGTSALTLSPGDLLFAQWDNNNYILGHLKSDGSFDIQTNTGSFAVSSNERSGAAICRYATSRVNEVFEFIDRPFTVQEVAEIMRDPWGTLLLPQSIPVTSGDEVQIPTLSMPMINFNTQVLKAPRSSQPTSAVQAADRGVYLATPYRITGPTGDFMIDSGGYYDLRIAQDGVVLDANTSDVSIDLRFSSGTMYGLLLIWDQTVASVTSSYTQHVVLCQAANHATSFGLNFGSSTGFLTNETACLIDVTNNRSGITDTLSIGRHILLIYWDAGLGRYVFRLDGRPATEIHTATPVGLQPASYFRYFVGRRNASFARIRPALVALSTNPSVDLCQYEDTPWQLFEPQDLNISDDTSPYPQLRLNY